MAVLTLLLGLTSVATAQTATFAIKANTGNDTLYLGLPGAASLSFDSQMDTLAGFVIISEVVFSNGNIIGPLNDTGIAANVVWGALSTGVFESKGWRPWIDSELTTPDTLFAYATDFGGSIRWVGYGTILTMLFVPSDTGMIEFLDYFDFIGNTTYFVGISGTWIPRTWHAPAITVVPCSAGNLDGGDANFDRVVNTSDIIYLVNHIFKSGPVPVIPNMGDTNCSGAITSADIIFLIGYVFKSLEAPCDPCETVQ
jgi:hypothetical protein